MLHTLTDTLLEFSRTHSLWQAAKKSGLICLENWMKDCPEEYALLCPTLTPIDFRFKEHSQQLIFSQYGSAVFITRTKYSLLISSQQDDYDEVGWYALDVNQEGQHVDDWLVIR
jgi:hypothetical protein